MWERNSVTEIARRTEDLLLGGLCVVLMLFGTARGEGSYRLGVGDLVAVKVLGEAEFTGDFRVRKDGSIDYPYLRSVVVEGRTSEELAESLTGRLKEGYLKDPQVTVDVREYHSQQVQVFGAVQKPGAFMLRDETRVLDVISLAGGLAPNGGKRILLLRKVTKAGEGVVEPLVIDYYQLVNKGDFSQNLVLQGGDVLNVPKINEVSVLGNIAKPGMVPFEPGLTLLKAVSMAGDLTPLASAKNTYVIRRSEKGEEKIEVRLDRIREGKEKDFVLNADDVIYVPESFF